MSANISEVNLSMPVQARGTGNTTMVSCQPRLLTAATQYLVQWWTRDKNGQSESAVSSQVVQTA